VLGNVHATHDDMPIDAVDDDDLYSSPGPPNRSLSRRATSKLATDPQLPVTAKGLHVEIASDSAHLSDNTTAGGVPETAGPDAVETEAAEPEVKTTHAVAPDPTPLPEWAETLVMHLYRDESPRCDRVTVEELLGKSKIPQSKSKNKQLLRWIHLPANNMVWVEVCCDTDYSILSIALH
jgi:hypothetical protein